MGLQEAPLILEILKAKEVTMRAEEGGIIDSTIQIKSLHKRKALMRKNVGKPQRMKYSSRGP